MTARNDEPLLLFTSARDWERWLEEHHAEGAPVWLRIAKKDSGAASVTYAEALDAALCFGWIDGLKGAVNERFWRQRFTPRGPKSKWSQRNRERACALASEGRMRPSGVREIERAMADGRWDAAYPGQRAAEVPADLQAALDERPVAAAFFATLDRANRYAILYRVGDAQRPDTRARRIAQFVAMLERGEKLHR